MIGIERSAGSALIPARCRATVHDRQLDIHQDKIGALFCDCWERLLVRSHNRRMRAPARYDRRNGLNAPRRTRETGSDGLASDFELRDNEA
jgi:hypothetical protein